MVELSYATASVGADGGATYIGGLVGYNSGYSAGIDSSFAAGNVSVGTNSTAIGGLVGYNTGSITNAYAIGAVSAASGWSSVGGLVGFNDSSSDQGYISTTYAAGKVTVDGTGVDGNVGGLVGQNTGSVYDSFWDVTVNPSPMPGIGGGTGGSSFSTTGLSTVYATNLGSINAVFSESSVWSVMYPSICGDMCGPAGYTYPSLNLLNALGAPQPVVGGWTSATVGGIVSTVISTPWQLAGMGTAGDWVLGGNIDMSNVSGSSSSFNPIGSAGGTPFTGLFNGQGYSISNLSFSSGFSTVSSGFSAVGLFGNNAGTISNLNLVDFLVSGTGDDCGNLFIGALAGINSGIITNVTVDSTSKVTGSVTSGTGSTVAVGGLVGWNNGGTISAATSSATVTGTTASVGSVTSSWDSGTLGVGGLAGINSSGYNDSTGNWVYGLVTNSSATGSVGGTIGGTTQVAEGIGGLVGINQSYGTITSSYASGNVSGDSNVGGLVGFNDSTNHRKNDDDVVRQPVTPQCAESSQDQADNQRQHHRAHPQFERNGETQADQLRDAEVLAGKGRPEIAMCQVAQIAQVLLRDGFVQMIGVHQIGLHFRRDDPPGIEGSPGRQPHHQECQGNDDEQRGNGPDDAFDQHGQQVTLPLQTLSKWRRKWIKVNIPSPGFLRRGPLRGTLASQSVEP